MKVLSLVDRETGQQRSLVVDSVNGQDMLPIVTANIAARSAA